MKPVVTVEFIKECVHKVAKAFDLKKVSLFGSYANGNPTRKSDIDLLVEFREFSVCLFTLIGLQLKLEELTGKKVDVVHAPIPKSSIIRIDSEVPIYG